MKTPERSVEEIVEEYEQKLAYFLYSFPLDQRKRLTILNMHTEALTQTLQAERQKRDEMVEAEREKGEERERKFAEMMLTLIERGNADTAFNFIKKKALTQPNNPRCIECGEETDKENKQCYDCRNVTQ